MPSPPFLRSGDRIGIVAPARKIIKRELKPALKVFREWKLDVVPGSHIFEESHQFSGSDEVRADDLQQMLDDESIRAVFCARGGYGTVRIVDRLNLTRFAQHPKWIVGFSDVTVLHSHIHQTLGIPTLHGMMPLNIVRGKKMEARKEALESLRRALFGEPLPYEIPAHPFNRAGTCSGKLVGGNLSLLYSLLGSCSDIDTRGKILFIEDLDEYLYHIDRMMMALRRAGKFDHLNGMIVGGMTQMRDNKVPFGKTAEEIVAEHLRDYDFPVCFGFPAGHIEDNRALILGEECSLKIDASVWVGHDRPVL
jgi:muramoyltetrapeptide carboxypeptidase